MRIVRACVRFSETINIELFSESQPSVAKKVEREREKIRLERERGARLKVCAVKHVQLSKQSMVVC